MDGLHLEHADPLCKKLSRSRLPNSALSHGPEDVAEERWARDDMFCLDPIFHEVRGFKPGRWAKKKPKGYPSTWRLLDMRGRVLAMVREHDDFGGGRLRRDELLVLRHDGQTPVAHVEGATEGNPAGPRGWNGWTRRVTRRLQSR
ncbi:MAG: hypothetical protein AAGK04_08515 [Planctomycetota bacterium]